MWNLCGFSWESMWISKNSHHIEKEKLPRRISGGRNWDVSNYKKSKAYIYTNL